MTKGSVEAEPGAGSAFGSLLVPCPVLIGRTRELDVLTSALDAAVAGEGRLIVLSGEAGIGKSRLAHELVATAAQRGVRILRGRAVPGSYGAAFRPLTEALAPAAAEIIGDDVLEPWLPALSGIVPTVTAPSATDHTIPVRGEAVLRVLRSLCDTGGGVLVLEDLHWADDESVAVVEHLADHLARTPVLGVVTVRPEEPGAAAELVRRIASRRSAPVLELSRLNEAQVAAMVHSCTSGTSSLAVDRVTAMAEGVPFLVEEMLASGGLPDSFAEGVRVRLAGLPTDAQRVVLAAAAFGRYFDWHLLGAAAGVAQASVVDALERGVAARLLAVDGDGFRFRHALTAEAVFQSVIPPRREALARQALEAFDLVHPDPPAELREVAARLAERAGSRERAGLLHRASGEEALRRGALRTAVAALERAVELLAAEERITTEERLLEALTLAGRIDEALSLGTRLVAQVPASRAVPVHLRLAGAAATASRWVAVDAQLAAARPLVDATDAPHAIRAELAVREAELALGTDDGDRAEQRAGDALRTARAEGLHEIECEALQLLGRCARRSSLQAAERWFREALLAAETHGLALAQLKAQHEIGTIGLLERSAVDDLLAAQRLAETIGAMATAAVLDVEIAAGYAGMDEVDAVARHGESAVRRATQLGLDLVQAYGWMHLSYAALMRGDAVAGATAAASARSAAPGDRAIDGLLIGAELLAALFADDLRLASELAARCTATLREAGQAPPAHHRAAWPVLLALDGDPTATDAIEEIERAGLTVSRGARAWLMLARAIVAGGDDPALAGELARDADSLLVTMPMWRAVGRRIAAEAAARDGWSIPSGWLAEAEASARTLGFEAVADSCRRLQLPSPDGLPAEWARFGVSRREADVLRLVVEGCSNREIAERLYVSVRTVEKHVESLLRKTATRTRTQLARVATTPGAST